MLTTKSQLQSTNESGSFFVARIDPRFFSSSFPPLCNIFAFHHIFNDGLDSTTDNVQKFGNPDIDSLPLAFSCVQKPLIYDPLGGKAHIDLGKFLPHKGGGLHPIVFDGVLRLFLGVFDGVEWHSTFSHFAVGLWILLMIPVIFVSPRIK